MYRYAFDQLSEDDFESLVIVICRRIFGEGTHAFAKGPDGGRDGSFNGKAQFYPSAAKPWEGKIIIQAKHTSDLNASCTDNDFFKNDSSVINKEICRLNKLKVETGEKFDCYLIFTNRKLTGAIHPIIVAHLMNKLVGLSKADIVGVEELSNFVDMQPNLVQQFGLNRFSIPDRFYEQDIRKVILLFSRDRDWMYATPIDDGTFVYIDKEKKNRLNQLDDQYFADIKEHSLQFFSDIDAFLENPMNDNLKRDYLNTVADLRGYLLKNSDRRFKELLGCIISEITGKPGIDDVFKERSLVRVFVHYMYWNCDIGRKS